MKRGRSNGARPSVEPDGVGQKPTRRRRPSASHVRASATGPGSSGRAPPPPPAGSAPDPARPARGTSAAGSRLARSASAEPEAGQRGSRRSRRARPSRATTVVSSIGRPATTPLWPGAGIHSAPIIGLRCDPARRLAAHRRHALQMGQRRHHARRPGHRPAQQMHEGDQIGDARIPALHAQHRRHADRGVGLNSSQSAAQTGSSSTRAWPWRRQRSQRRERFAALARLPGDRGVVGKAPRKQPGECSASKLASSRGRAGSGRDHRADANRRRATPRRWRRSPPRNFRDRAERPTRHARHEVDQRAVRIAVAVEIEAHHGRNRAAAASPRPAPAPGRPPMRRAQRRARRRSQQRRSQPGVGHRFGRGVLGRREPERCNPAIWAARC